MDKLRGMEYLVRVVEARGFAAAARELDVSPPAVTQMIAALENQLGTKLLRRASRGVSLTSDGEQYYRMCVQTLTDVRGAEANLRASCTRATGLLVVGMSRNIARNCIMPNLADFMARHPDLKLDIRTVHTTDDPVAALVDMMVINAWLDHEDMVEKHIAQARYVTCAAPAYWRLHGIPKDPDELQKHITIAYRSSRGVVMDQWKYRRGKLIKSVSLRPQLVCDDQDSALESALRGLGVVRRMDLTTWSLLQGGLLVPVLEDWEALEAPPIRLLYRRGMGSSAGIRAFAAFVTEVFERLKAARAAAGYDDPSPQPIPAWYRTKWVGGLTRRALKHRS